MATLARMRLSADEHAAIADAAREVLGPGTRVSLFGSRVDDGARGGDIDLLVETDQPLSADQWVDRRSAFVARLYRRLGERRVDVLLAGPGVLAAPMGVLAAARHRAIELVRT